ncbi:alpha/beta fold hydrolase [Microlunatus speluncae]|uniref:alpha/beta fold hydrolase n=1 Tax=Microlunatus speluncae TaxID=2594267 RepID=UPI0012665373|nr:alpha/beta hydrolase [Microlunatus speluncae]
METITEIHPDGAAPEQLIKVGDVELCAQTFGRRDDPAVLLVAGTSCSLDWWPAPFCSRLADRGLFVIRFDQRDTGRSTADPAGQPSYALRDLVSDAVGVLDAHGIDRAHWVGFSMGGWIAQLAALDHPDRVAALVLVSSRTTGHGPADPDLPEVADRLLAGWESAAEPDWAAPAAVVDYLVEAEGELAGAEFDEPTVRLMCERAVARTPDLRPAVTNHPMLDQGPRWRERLGQVAAPTLVLHGEDDPMFPPRHAGALAAAIPGATLRLIPGVGHELPPRHWADYARAIADHVR